MKVHLCLLPVVLLALANRSVLAFNVDTYNYIRHEVEPNSMFGFSVALHKEDNKGWVLIGAPEAESLQPGVVRGGVVYRCDISDDNRCQAVPFDRNGNSRNNKLEQTDTKSHQWFGATVTSAGMNGPIVACAPRYVFHTMNPRKVERNEPVGTCYMLKHNFTNSREISPCRTSYWGYHRQGSCQAGLSAAVTKDGKRLFIGAPGSWYWQGQAYSINTNAAFPYKPPLYSQFGEGQVYSTDVNNPENKVYATGESTSSEDDSYLGYSTTTGDFDGDGVQDVAVGMPRGGGLLGKVLIFSWDMVNQDNITGEQIGAYFGYSLCAVDVDGDGLDDLLIGAPMYTEPNNEGKYEMGRVYIMFQGEVDKFKALETRDGTTSKGRFGLALTSLGDMNLDGYGDFAVGAPYDGPNNKGAVYIYHGSKTGPLAKYSQVIYAEDLTIPYLSTFGFSLSGGLDLDGNLYPDLVVGAYESSKAIFFKSRPVAVVEASTVFLAESKLISLDNKNCKTARDRKEVTCTKVKSCLKYNGINLPTALYLDVSWVLDSKKPKSPRMFFFNDEGKNVKNSTMSLFRGKPECREEEVYITDNIRDKLTPLEVEMRYNLVPKASTGIRRKRETPEPVIDSNLGLIKRDSINIQKNCGPDNICIPDLRLSIKTVDQYLLGSKDLLTIDVLISNHGEDAFEAGFYMNMPQDLNFKKIERIGDMRDTPVTCTAPSPATNHTLKCDIGNPLSAGKVANFKVNMIPSTKAGMAPSYDFYMEANSTNPEREGSGFDNVIKKSIGIWIETDLSIEGISIPDQQLYNISEFKSIENATTENHLGPHVVHMYNIRNNGPSTIQEAEVFILWPYETKAGDMLMYLLNQPETSGNIQCTPTTYANQRDFLLDTKLSRKSFLYSRGMHDVNNAEWYAKQQGVHTEHRQSGASFSSSSSASSGSRASVALSESEKRRLQEEENLESKGDASYVHSQRAQAAAASSTGSSAVSGASADAGAGTQRGFAGQRQHSYQTSWSSSSQDGAPPRTFSASRNRTVVQGADGNYYVRESSTEHVGLAGFAHSPITQFDESRNSYSGGHASQAQNQAVAHRENQQYTGGQYYGASGSQSSYGRQGSQFSEQPAPVQHTNQFQVSREGSQGEQRAGASSQGGSFRGQNEYREGQIGGQYQAGTVHGSQYQAGESQYQTAGVQAGTSQDRRYQASATQERYNQAGVSQDRQHQAAGSQSGFYNQGGGSRQTAGEANYEANRLESGREAGGRGFAQQTNYDSIDLEAQRRAYAEQSGVSSRRRMKSQQDGEPVRPDLITGATGLEEMAQGGHGFKVSTFDLGISNRGNVDDELRRNSGEIGGGFYSQSQSNQGQYGGGSSAGSSGGASAGSSYYSQSQSGGSGGSAGGYQTYSSSSYGSESRGQQQSQHDGQSYSMGSDPKLTLYPRIRREVQSIEDEQDRELEKALHCDIVRCAAIRCVVGPLAHEDGAWIAIRTRLVASTLHKLAPSVPMNVSTRAVSRVTKLPYIGTPKDMPIKSRELTFTATPEPVAKPDVVPLWVVVLSACAGAVILLLLVFLLYKCGFFNRNRPSDSSERQPLNRNGNYHGDEHL